MKELLKEFLPKLLSGRYYMTIIFTSSYCLIMIGLTIALLKKLINTDTYIALLATFTLVVRQIADDYFKRTDRKNGGG